MAIYSLNEIDVHCKKAARGVGLEWGYAEEIGKVARWLAAYELPGIEVLTRYLVEINANPEAFGCPELDDNVFSSSNKRALCPIHTGAYLSDLSLLQTDQPFIFKNLAYPMLLLPYLAQIINARQASLSYNYQKTVIHFANGMLDIQIADSLNSELADEAQCHTGHDSVQGKQAGVCGQQVDKADWQQLNEFACRTYVPASEASRQGAGPAE